MWPGALLCRENSADDATMCPVHSYDRGGSQSIDKNIDYVYIIRFDTTDTEITTEPSYTVKPWR